jgi:hypothetical protein
LIAAEKENPDHSSHTHLTISSVRLNELYKTTPPIHSSISSAGREGDEYWHTHPWILSAGKSEEGSSQASPAISWAWRNEEGSICVRESGVIYQEEWGQSIFTLILQLQLRGGMRAEHSYVQHWITSMRTTEDKPHPPAYIQEHMHRHSLTDIPSHIIPSSYSPPEHVLTLIHSVFLIAVTVFG